MTGRPAAVAALTALALVATLGTGAQAAGKKGHQPAAGDIATVAGSVGGPAAATSVSLVGGPCGVSFGGGNVYAGDNFSVRQVSPSTDGLTTPAGTGQTGPLGDGGPAASASVSGACGVSLAPSANLAFADTNNDRIRVVAGTTGTFFGQAMTAGDVYTVAGDGTDGFSGDGGPGPAAELFLNPAGAPAASGVATDSAGNLIFADTGNQRIRVVAATSGTFFGQAMTAGDVYSIAGNGTAGFAGDKGAATSAEVNQPSAVAVATGGDVVLADTGNQRIRVIATVTGKFFGQSMTAGDMYSIAGNGHAGFSGDTGAAVLAKISDPSGAALDSAGNLLIADAGNNRVRVVAAKTATFYGTAMTVKHIYTIAGNGTAGFKGDGAAATAAELSHPDGVALDSSGNVLISDSGNGRLRVLAAKTASSYGQSLTTGDIYTVAGNGTAGYSGDTGPATAAQLGGPDGVAADAAGNTLIADSADNRVRVAAAANGTFYGVPMTAGNIYTVAGTGTAGLSNNTGLATKAELNFPTGVAADAHGNLLIADKGNSEIRVVAGSTATFYGVAMTAGHIYDIAGNGTAGFTGDGGAATSAELEYPSGVAGDSAGNVLIADTLNQRVRVVAAVTGTFYGVAMTAGDMYTVAGNSHARYAGDGGPAVSGSLDEPAGVATDGAGNLLIADTDNDRIRAVAAASGTFYGQAMTAGDIYTVAGDGFGDAGDGGPATAALLENPAGVAADAVGNLIIADSGNEVVRVVAAGGGSFYGQPMTTGDIYTVAGDGTAGFGGDGGAAASAELSGPSDVAVAGTDVLIADTGNNRIRILGG